jgi:hypothetical protein
MASGPSRAPPYLLFPRALQGSLQDNTNSPWSANDGGDLMDNLTLPPINPYSDAGNHFDLPPFVDNHPHFLAVDAGASSPNHPWTFASNNLTSAPPQDVEQSSQPEPPPSNQQQSSRPRPRRGSFTEHYRISSSPDPYGSFIDLDDPQGLDDLEGFSEVEDQKQPESTTAEMPTMTRRASRRASIVDLTSSPTQERPPKRKRDVAGASDGGPRKVAKPAVFASSKNRPSVPPKDDPDVEVLDLAEIENEEQYQELKEKEAAALSKKQAMDEATRPVKLAHFNCIICMDQPTDLTVTHCGMYSF